MKTREEFLKKLEEIENEYDSSNDTKTKILLSSIMILLLDIRDILNK